MRRGLAVAPKGQLEDPARCLLCEKLWDFGTDVLGRLVAIHPITPCVPPPPPAFLEEIEPLSERETQCAECGMRFRPTKVSAGSQRVCGNICRKSRRDRKHRESEARCKREVWKRWNAGRAA